MPLTNRQKHNPQAIRRKLIFEDISSIASVPAINMEDREFTNGASSGSAGGLDGSPPSRQQLRSPAPSRMTRDTPPGRIYVGNLPPDADRKFVEDLFIKYGRILDISVKKTVSGTIFAFVEYHDPRDAQDAIRDKDGAEIDGCLLRVETPFQNRGGPLNGPSRGPNQRLQRAGASGRRGEFRLVVHGLPPSGSWQDLKDHMREAGECLFADVYRDGTGVVEFARIDDMEYALRHFQDSKFRSHEGETSHITLSRDESRPALHSGGYREDNRRSHRYSSNPYPSSPYGGNRGGYTERYNDHRTGPTRGGYDSYRSGGYSDVRTEDRGYAATRRRSPSYSRRSRSRSRSYNRYR